MDHQRSSRPRQGPFSTEQVVDLINAGHLDGEEEIARYPGTEWFPITQDPQFYDKLIEILSAQPYRPEDGFEELSKSPIPYQMCQSQSTNRNQNR